MADTAMTVASAGTVAGAEPNFWINAIEVVGKWGYFGLAAFVFIALIIRETTSQKKVPREFYGLAVVALILGFLSKWMDRHGAGESAQYCRTPSVVVTLSPASLRQLAVPLGMKELPLPLLSLSTKQACAQINRPADLVCPQFNFDFPIEKDHEGIQVSYISAVEALQERLTNLQNLAAAATVEGASK